MTQYDSWLTIGIDNGDLNNKLSSVGIETADAADKVVGTFTGSYATIASYTTSTITA